MPEVFLCVQLCVQLCIQLCISLSFTVFFIGWWFGFWFGFHLEACLLMALAFCRWLWMPWSNPSGADGVLSSGRLILTQGLRTLFGDVVHGFLNLHFGIQVDGFFRLLGQFG